MPLRTGTLRRRALLGQAGALALAPRAARAQPGGTIRVAAPTPAGAIDPLTVSESGGTLMLCQTGEFLTQSGADGVLRPMLATQWWPNEDATLWHFALRQGVLFHDGTPFTAADVVATMDRLADPRHGSNALSVLRGVLAPGGARARDALTVEFHLDAPCGHFAHYVSSDNYNAIMLPAHYDGKYERHFIGTGPFRLARYTAHAGASFVRNPTYWGRPALPARTVFSFFGAQAPQILALEDGQVDVIASLAVQGAQGLLTDARFRTVAIPSAIQRHLHMRTDCPPFSDARIRRAVALSLDRPGLVHGLFDGRAQLGNDSPFAPIYPSSAPAPQRQKNIAGARALLQQAGAAGGFSAVLTTERYGEIADYAVIVQNACAEIGITLNLRIEEPASYYGTAQRGASDWLDSTMGITEYGHRGVPDAILSAALTSHGVWNSARFANPAYDKLVASYIAATDPMVQREAARRIEALLLDQTPVVIAYFCDYLFATGARVRGVQASAISQIFLQDASIA